MVFVNHLATIDSRPLCQHNNDMCQNCKLCSMVSNPVMEIFDNTCEMLGKPAHF